MRLTSPSQKSCHFLNKRCHYGYNDVRPAGMPLAGTEIGLTHSHSMNIKIIEKRTDSDTNTSTSSEDHRLFTVEQYHQRPPKAYEYKDRQELEMLMLENAANDCYYPAWCAENEFHEYSPASLEEFFTHDMSSRNIMTRDEAIEFVTTYGNPLSARVALANLLEIDLDGSDS